MMAYAIVGGDLISDHLLRQLGLMYTALGCRRVGIEWIVNLDVIGYIFDAQRFSFYLMLIDVQLVYKSCRARLIY